VKEASEIPHSSPSMTTGEPSRSVNSHERHQSNQVPACPWWPDWQTLSRRGSEHSL